MITRLKSFLAYPIWENPSENRISKLLNTILLSLIFLVWLGAVAGLFFAEEGFLNAVLIRVSIVSLILLASLVLLRNRYLRAAALTFVILGWILITVFTAISGGVYFVSFSHYMLIILVSAILLGKRAGIIFAILSTLSGGVLVYLNQNGLLAAPVFMVNEYGHWASLAIGFLSVSALLYYFIADVEVLLKQLQLSNERLEAEKALQQKRVIERTRILQTSLDVSRALSTILDRDELVSAVVYQVQSVFSYYHVHIFLMDRERQSVLMVGGTGKAGQMLLERGHKIVVGKGVVGQAAVTKQPVLVPDVTQSAIWLPNALLPETKAELAVPILRGNEVIGVLDVQQNVVGLLGDEDVELLQLIAGQVSIALQNADSFAQTQQRAQYEFLVNRIGQKIQQAGTIEDVFNVTTQELGEALNASEVKVVLGSALAKNGQQKI